MDYEVAMIRVTNGVAVGGITMPAWVPSLGEVSSMASDAVPILSALWLAIQIVGYARKRWVA